MSERRRRRKLSGESGSGSEESESEEVKEIQRPESGKESGPEHVESEYESAEDEETALDPKSDGENESDHPDIEFVDGDGGDGGGEELFPGLERQQGDGEENPDLEDEDAEKNLDDDEDKKNPQYIPKRGMFYEHDDRIDPADEVEEEEKVEVKKKVWKSDATEKWGHDKFMEDDQIPKSKDELVTVYGYDIRNEDNAPRARRRRRYGRGPNKYTRNWEDEEAYVKPAVPKGRGTTGKTGGRKEGAENDEGSEASEQLDLQEEFPPLVKAQEAPLEKAQETPVVKAQETPVNKREEKQRNTDRGDGRIKDEGENWDRDREHQNHRDRDYQNQKPVNNRGRGRGDMNNGGRGGRNSYSNQNQRSRGGRPWANEDRNRMNGDRNGREDDMQSGYHPRGVRDNGPHMENRGGGRGRSRGRGRGMDTKQNEYNAPMKNKNSRNNHADDGWNDDWPENNKDNRPKHGRIKDEEEDWDKEEERSKRPDHAKDERLEMEGNGNRGPQESDRTQQRGAKRYSNQRRGGPDNNPSYNQGNRYPDSNSMLGYPQARPSAPFISNSPASRLPMNPASPAGAPYIHPGLHHPGLQFPVPVSSPVPISMVGGPDPNLVKALQASAPGGVTPLMLPPVVSPDVLLAAAAEQSFTTMRGGVTYFNPTAQNILLQRPMSKRPKAAIAIVDPSTVQSTPPDSDSAPNELDSHSSTREFSQETEFENNDKIENNEPDSRICQETSTITNEGLLSEQ